MLDAKQESCEYQLFKSFDLTLRGIEPRFTDHKAGILITTLTRRIYIILKKAFFVVFEV